MAFVLVVVVYAVAIGDPSFGAMGPLAIGLSLLAMVFAGEPIACCPALPCPALPCPALPCPALPYDANCPQYSRDTWCVSPAFLPAAKSTSSIVCAAPISLGTSFHGNAIGHC